MHSPALGKSRTKGTSRGPDLNTSGSGSPWVLVCWEKGQERSREVLGGGGDGPPAVMWPSGLGLSPGLGARYLRSAGRGSLGGPVPA